MCYYSRDTSLVQCKSRDEIVAFNFFGFYWYNLRGCVDFNTIILDMKN